MVTVERSFRGISQRLAMHYLENLGGEHDGDDRVTGDGWRVELSEKKVSVGPSLTLNEVDLVFEGDPAVLEPLMERFEQKARRAGG